MSDAHNAARPAPVRRCRPVDEWPASDRAAWETALRPGDPFEAGGLAAPWPEISRRVATGGYGRWLGWLDAHGFLDPNVPFEERATRERVAAYAAFLTEEVSPFTVVSYIENLGNALRAMAPHADWRWILRAAYRLRTQAKSVRHKRARLQSPARLAALGKQIMADAEVSGGSPLDAAVLYRNGLIIAFLAHRPIRGRNLAGMAVGGNLTKRTGAWWVAFTPSETKTKRPLEFPFPADLVPRLERYLEKWRPILLTRDGRQAPAAIDAFWVSKDATALGYQTISDHVERHTCGAFGAPINPHLFRDCAATAIAIVDPEHVRDIVAILGHAGLATSERHYNQARTLEAGRRYNDALGVLRGRGR